MYGMVNRAIEDLITAAAGEAGWDEVCRRANFEAGGFVSNQPYPDALTYRLLLAAAEVTGRPVPDLLRALGDHWISRTAVEGYGHMLTSAGRTLPDFLKALPSLHARVELIFPGLQPPQFEVVSEAPGQLTLAYRTRRPGLEPFVEGLLAGLGRHFRVDLAVTRSGQPADGPEGERFLVTWSQPA